LLNKILRYPEKIPSDKRLHALIGVVLSSILLSLNINLYIFIAVLFIVAWGIEYYQLATKSGNFDHYDAIAVVVGGLLVLAPYLLKGYNEVNFLW